MKSWMPITSTILVLVLTACGSKKAKETKTTPEAPAAPKEEAKEEKQKKDIESAKKKIRAWLSTDLVKKISDAGQDLGKDIGFKIAANKEVLAKAKKLSTDVFKHKDVKPRLKKVEEKATAGFKKKLTLGWKALRSGGIDEFKKKVNEDAQRVASEVLSVYLKDTILKDERTAELLKGFAPVLKLQAKLAAVSLQENLSPRVTKQIVGIAFRIVAAGDSEAMATRVDKWIKDCESDVDPKIETLVADVSALESVNKAAAALATEVVTHPRTKKELVALVVKLVDDKSVNNALVKVYEAAAFEKGDPAIKEALEKVLAIKTVDRELFATMTRLAESEGAGAIIGKHLTTISEDPKLAAIVEDFIVSVLETCGDPTES